ncbi:MAG: hypothetical protein SNJ72_07725 [Fimbriimonadales bacterium]
MVEDLLAQGIPQSLDNGLGRRVSAERGGSVHRYLYGADNTLLAEGSGSNWAYCGHGGAMYRLNETYQHWNLLRRKSCGGSKNRHNRWD